MLKNKDKTESHALITFRYSRKYNKIVFFICIFMTILGFCIGVYFADSNLYNFICSCAVGVTCGYITGYISTYFADKQTAGMLEIDYKINKIDELIKKCDFETNLFSYNSMMHPQKINIYNLEGDSNNYYACLNRMIAVFEEISNCDIGDFRSIEVDFYADDITAEKIKITDFKKRFNTYQEEQLNKYNKINLSFQQCNNMFFNAITIKYELEKMKDNFIIEKENMILNKK